MRSHRDSDMLVGKFRKEKTGKKKMQKCWCLRGRGESWLGGGDRVETKADPQLHTASRKKGNQRREDEIPEWKNSGNWGGLKPVDLGSLGFAEVQNKWQAWDVTY